MNTIAYNVYGFDGYQHRAEWGWRGKTGGKDPIQSAREIGEALKIYNPDIVTTSESRDEASVAALADTLEYSYSYFPCFGRWPGAIITRYPIIESKNCPVIGKRRIELFTRHWGRAVLETDKGTLIVHSVHTYAGTGDVRYLEVKEILKTVTEDIYSGLPVLLQGDLNHTPNGPEYPLWQEAGLIDTYAQLASDPDTGKTLLRPEPVARLDYVFATSNLKLTEARPLYENDFRLYADRPDFIALSDHLPQMATFEF